MPAGFYKDQYGDKKEAAVKIPTENIPGPKKAAIVMVALGSKASDVFGRSNQEDRRRAWARGRTENCRA